MHDQLEKLFLLAQLLLPLLVFERDFCWGFELLAACALAALAAATRAAKATVKHFCGSSQCAWQAACSLCCN
jgi:hypothetical protein